MVQTDVGIKCPDDARLPRGARAGVMKRGQILKSLLAGLAVAVVGFFVVFAIFEIRFFTLIFSALAGYGAGKLIHRAGGRNGGAVAMAISGVAVALAYAPFIVQDIAAGNVYRILAALIAVGVAIYTSR
jgi:hypothetical protein